MLTFNDLCSGFLLHYFHTGQRCQKCVTILRQIFHSQTHRKCVKISDFETEIFNTGETHTNILRQKYSTLERLTQNISVIETVCIFCRIRWHEQKFQLPATNRYWQQIKGLLCLSSQIKIWHLWTELSTIISVTSASFWACFSFLVVSVPTMSHLYCNKVRKVYCKQTIRCTTDCTQKRATLVRT